MIVEVVAATTAAVAVVLIYVATVEGRVYKRRNYRKSQKGFCCPILTPASDSSHYCFFFLLLLLLSSRQSFKLRVSGCSSVFRSEYWPSGGVGVVVECRVCVCMSCPCE